MARTVEKKCSAEYSNDYPFKIKTGWQIRTQIRWDDNIPRGRICEARLEITTEGCDKPRISLKAWCVRANIGRFAEGSSDSLDRIKVRTQISWDENLPIDRLGDVRFDITTEGCDELCLSLKAGKEKDSKKAPLCLKSYSISYGLIFFNMFRTMIQMEGILYGSVSLRSACTTWIKFHLLLLMDKMILSL